jgi:PAS domain S-box-containing protein
MPAPSGHGQSEKERDTASQADLDLAEKLRQTAPELATYLDGWIKEAAHRTPGGAPLELFLSRLITEANAALAREQAELAVVLANPHEEAVLVLDSLGVITEVCRHSEGVLGRDRRDLIGMPIDLLLEGPTSGIETSASEMDKAARGERVRTFRTQQREDGSTFESSHTVVALVGPMGELSGFARRIEDLSQKKQHEFHIEVLTDSIALLIRRQK